MHSARLQYVSRTQVVDRTAFFVSQTALSRFSTATTDKGKKRGTGCPDTPRRRVQAGPCDGRRLVAADISHNTQIAFQVSRYLQEPHPMSSLGCTRHQGRVLHPYTATQQQTRYNSSSPPNRSRSVTRPFFCKAQHAHVYSTTAWICSAGQPLYFLSLIGAREHLIPPSPRGILVISLSRYSSLALVRTLHDAPYVSGVR